MQESGWIMNMIRSLFASITYCIFELIEFVLQGIFDLAGLQTNSGFVGEITSRIYVLLGIFMVFKLTISFLKYMVSPDTLSDKEKGAGKLIARTITMLGLLIMLPMLFPLLGRVQTEFLPVLPKVILGQEQDNSDTVSDSAEIMSVSILQAFYKPSEGLDESDRPAPIGKLDDLMDTVTDSVDGYYAYNFNYIIAPVVGIVVVIILLSMTIKIGIRVFKMLILEMIAPIPVMSYIDPKSSKDGAFASWSKQLMTTFLDIFVRLGVIYIVLIIITAWAEDPLRLSGLFNPASVPTGGRLLYLQVFLIIALLMFAKDAPNFIKDAFGIKHDKDTSGFLAGATGFVSGAATGAVSGAISGHGLRGAITGAATGANAGFQGGMTGKKANVWSTAGDAALQARTGDSKAKSGLLNAIQKSAVNAQLKGSARKLNLSDNTIESAKQNMIDMQGLSAQAQRNWEYGIQTGNWVDLDGNASDMDTVSKELEKASAASTKATKNYEKLNKAGDAYGINRSFAADLKHERNKAKSEGKPKAVYKAAGRADPYKGRYK